MQAEPGQREPGPAQRAGQAAGPPGPVDVAITEDIWGPPLEELARSRSVLREPSAWQSPAGLAAAASRARALVVRNRSQVDRGLLEACPRLRVVARAGVGLDNIDVAAAQARGVAVIAPLGANAVSVAEHTLGLALALARRLVPLDRECRSGGWDRVPGRELSGAVWGLLGAGATGLACGRLATAVGARVLAYDPFAGGRDTELAAAGIRLASLDGVLGEAEILSCHLPATAGTRHFVDADLLARMRRGALFINVGRGSVVDEEALAAVLESGHLGGAGLDVREQEPPHPGVLERLDNVVLTPHVAGMTEQSQQRILQVLAADIAAVLDGGSPSNAVTVPVAAP
ncbi:MAG TPA: NAD(P)-dependent oxidoreductase [Streptosporangiaceae bacterium]|jgi:D-3-phosphoglycerate dehydrogenase/(S)-sulfolactate dehydrogenase